MGSSRRTPDERTRKADEDTADHARDDATLDVPVRKDPPPSPSPRASRHPDVQADLAERGDGAHAEQVTHEANLRADPDPPE